MPTACQNIPARFEDGRHLAFEAGAVAAGFKVKDVREQSRARGAPGDVLMMWNLHGANEIKARQFEDDGGSVMVCEEGYTRRLWPEPHFAVSLHGHNGSGTWNPREDASRWRRMGLKPADWRIDGGHVLVCGQRGIGAADMASPRGWHDDVARRLRDHTDRPIVIRPHPGKNKASAPPLAEHMRGAWAVVVWASGCAVHALLAGIPVVSEAPHHILGPALTREISMIEVLPFKNRDDAFVSMSWAQWTLPEIANGDPFRHLL